VAIVDRQEEVRFLQGNVVAFADYAWGDGQIFADYRCSPGVPVDRYASELHDLQAYLEQRGTLSVQDTSADLLRRYLLDLGPHCNPGGVQAAYRAMRADNAIVMR
jgi:hypothetical protein